MHAANPTVNPKFLIFPEVGEKTFSNLKESKSVKSSLFFPIYRHQLQRLPLLDDERAVSI
jgi:hypothetical protein